MKKTELDESWEGYLQFIGVPGPEEKSLWAYAPVVVIGVIILGLIIAAIS